VLGVDNLIFIAILSNKLPLHQQERARRIGLILALVMRIGLLMLIGWIVTLQQPLFDLGLVGPPVEGTNKASFETAFSGRDLILLARGLLLLWKATKEIHHSMEPEDASGDILDKTPGIAKAATATFGAVIVQIIAIDLVFSVDSILTAVGMTDDIPIMIAAVVITVGIMLVAATPLARFIEHNPTLVMLALAFLVMIGLVLIADGFGFHVPKGYIYAAMGFSLGVEMLNIVKSNAYRPQLVTLMQQERLYFEVTTRLASRTAIRRLHRPLAFERTPEVIAAIRDPANFENQGSRHRDFSVM